MTVWSEQSVNLSENTCFIYIIIPNLWIKRTAIILMYLQSMLLTKTET